MENPSLLLVALFALPLLLVARRGRRQQREFRELQDRLAPGQEVMTTSGMYATLVEVDPDRPDVVVLEPAAGVRMRWARAAVATIVSVDEQTADPGLDAVDVRDSSTTTLDSDPDGRR